MRFATLLLLCLALVMTACNRAGDETSSTSSLATATTTSDAATTTTEPPQPQTIQVTGLSSDLRAAVQNVYDRAIGAGNPAALPQRLNAALEHATSASGTVVGTATQATVLEDAVAVIRAGDDILLATDEGNGWEIVGFKLPSMDLPAVYGADTRLVFVVGSDARPGEAADGARADSLHVVAANPEQGTGAIVGIPRDAWVEPSEGRNRKFTEVLAVSGPEVLVETARLTTGLEIEGYLLTGFAGFVDLINEFGTLEIDIPMNMADRASQAYFSAGVQEIDGGDALAFARNRTIPGGDFTRQLHGGVLINWVGRAVQELGIEALPELLELLTTHITTDLGAADLLTLTAAVYELDLEETPNVVVPGRIGTAGSASVVFLEDGAASMFADLEDGELDIGEHGEP